MAKQVIEKLKLSFDDIVHTTEEGLEYWYARELCTLLGYSKWDKFQNVIEKAKTACRNSGYTDPYC